MSRQLVGLAALVVFTMCKKDEAPAPSASAAPTPASSAVTAASPSVVAAPAAAPPAPPAAAGDRLPSDTIPASGGGLRVTPIQHATFLLEVDGRAIYFDPVHGAHYEGLPKANVILITDIHGDHMDVAGIQAVRQATTTVVAPPAVADALPKDLGRVEVMKNGDKKKIGAGAADGGGLEVEAVPMYNLVRGPDAGLRFHDKGRGNGYVVTAGGKRLYVSGDTECIPEMKALKDIDVAFVCMNLPYTMPPSEAAECVNAFKPKIVYPYHYRQADLDAFTKAVAPTSGVEVRRRDWYPK
jgi:L-ascorbate metabolism protein UlaG (beta-lactamase superfamily)